MNDKTQTAIITPTNSKQKVEDAITVLTFFNDISDDLFKIIDLVQSNQKVFGGHGGESCVALAARKLEQVVTAEAPLNGNEG